MTKKMTAATLAKAKPAGVSDPFASAISLVNQAARTVDGDCVDAINFDYLSRRVNRAREASRPEEPKDMDFELNHDAIPEGFYKSDLKVDGRRHLIFATDEQLNILGNAKIWYMDGTFKSTRKPFEMLFTIHAFVRRGNSAKQVPLVYVLMSGKRTVDYEKVLRKIRNVLKPENLQQIVIDFEAAMWKACRNLFPGVQMRGCAFHWGQAVFRHVQSLGLTTEYLQDSGTYSFIRQLLCLPLLPYEHILPTFNLMREFNTSAHIEPLMEYISNTWMTSSIWPVKSWSVFGYTVRTNNDVEGWHRRLNGKTGCAPPFYVLIRSLHQESLHVDHQIQLVTEMKLQRIQRKSTRTVQSKLLSAWDDYNDGQMSATALLKRCSSFYKPKVPRNIAADE